jgi:predicted metal-dependent HD superfamily phosphohydrolase
MSIDEAALRTAWRSSLVAPADGERITDLPAEARRASEAAFEALLARYREPHRRYHGVTHLVWVLRHVRELAEHEPTSDLAAVRMAAFFHDAVYDPRATDNEDVSARLAATVLGGFEVLGWSPGRIAHVAAMVEATATHLVPDDDVDPGPTGASADATDLSGPTGDSADATDLSDPTGRRHDTAVLLDADLAILGADPAGYRAYVDGVRAEYHHVDDASWRRGRAHVLEEFLQRPALFHTPTAQQRWTARAHANLAAELAFLRT